MIYRPLKGYYPALLYLDEEGGGGLGLGDYFV